uniref:Uncharacterized protein n=1 Tax=Mesocestoides corti TaxID=53468 RepID=A0A5K3FB35_MESCO
MCVCARATPILPEWTSPKPTTHPAGLGDNLQREFDMALSPQTPPRKHMTSLPPPLPPPTQETTPRQWTCGKASRRDANADASGDKEPRFFRT